MLNFAAFKVQKSANERSSLLGVSRGQNFTFKFRKYNSKKGGVEAEETGYTISNKKFDELDLDNHGIVQFTNEGIAYIGVVANDDATMLKRTGKLKGEDKGRKFKSTILDKALIASGVIEDVADKTQYLDLVLIEGSEGQEIDGKVVKGLYQIVKGEEVKGEDGEDIADEDEKEITKDNDSQEDLSQGSGTQEENPSAPETIAPEADNDDF